MLRFWYATLLPAILLVPYWFHAGRYWLLLLLWGREEEGDWMDSDTRTTGPSSSSSSSTSMEREVAWRALPGILVFHLLLWWRERQRRRWRRRVNNNNEEDRSEEDENEEGVLLLEVVLGVAGIYILHFFWQVFYVVTVCEDDDHPAETAATNHTGNCHHGAKDWSVATRLLLVGGPDDPHHRPNSQFNTTVSSRIALGIALDVWILMMVTLLVSFWFTVDPRFHTWDSPTLLRLHMTQALWWAVGLVPVWHVLGHWVLGSGGFPMVDGRPPSDLWRLVGLAVFLLLPGHIWLWYRHDQWQRRIQLANNNHQDGILLLSRPMTWLWVWYFGLQILHQLVVLPQHAFIVTVLPVLSPKTAILCRQMLEAMLVVTLLLMLGMNYYEEQRETRRSEEQQETTSTPQDEIRVPLLTDQPTAEPSQQQEEQQQQQQQHEE